MWSFGVVWGFPSPCGVLRFRVVVACHVDRRVYIVGTGMGFPVLFLVPFLVSLFLCVGRAYRPPST